MRTLSDPMDCSPPGSSIRGIFQARALEWGATTLSNLLAHHWLNLYKSETWIQWVLASGVMKACAVRTLTKRPPVPDVH